MTLSVGDNPASPGTRLNLLKLSFNQTSPKTLKATDQGLTPRGIANEYLRSRRKRMMDIILATAFLVAGTPLFALLIVLVRLNSPGPSLFKQARHGRSRQKFLILKFRSMYHTNPSSTLVEQAKRDDVRVTFVGRYIRRTSLDELPQLINVLKGEMSLVGPRPHAISHDHHYSGYIPTYNDRFLALPGITGLAQVSGSRGGTPEMSDMKRRVDLDVDYIRRASLSLDCKILLKTVFEVFVSNTAY